MSCMKSNTLEKIEIEISEKLTATFTQGKSEGPSGDFYSSLHFRGKGTEIVHFYRESGTRRILFKSMRPARAMEIVHLYRDPGTAKALFKSMGPASANEILEDAL